MYYAITIDADGRITAVHESAIALTADTFAGGAYAGQEVRPVTQAQEYRAGYLLAEYGQDGRLRPLIDRIMEGLTEAPDGYEVIDGELVQTQVPEAEAPPTLMARVVAAEEAAQNSRAEEAKATRVLFRALAQTDVITAVDALDNAGMFPVWSDRVGSDTKVGEYMRHEDGLYRVKQAHKIQEHYPPSTATAALYSKVTMPGEIPDWSPGNWAKDVKVKHNGKIWLSMVDNNTWEPGAAGVYENIWKEVAA